MRYQIRAASPEVYNRVLPLLHKEATVYVESQRRLMVAAGDVDDDLRGRLEGMGAMVRADYEYGMDPVPQ